jgi:hypothetical protein
MSIIHIKIIISIIIVSFSACAGWILCDKHHDAERFANVTRVLETQRQIDFLNTKMSSIVDSESSHVKTQYKTIIKQVPQYIPISNSNVDCNLSDDSRRLLNEAVAGYLSNTSSNTDSTTAGLTPD